MQGRYQSGFSPAKAGFVLYRSISTIRYRHSSISFEKVTGSNRFITRKHGFPNLFNYVDDLIYCGTPSNIYSAFHFLCDLIRQLGVDVNPKKLVQPLLLWCL